MAQSNPFHGQSPGVLGPWVNATPIVPSDVNVNPPNVSYRGLYVGGAGNINVVLRDDTLANAVVLAVPAGFIDRLWIKQILATNTTATGLIGFN